MERGNQENNPLSAIFPYMKQRFIYNNFYRIKWYSDGNSGIYRSRAVIIYTILRLQPRTIRITLYRNSIHRGPSDVYCRKRAALEFTHEFPAILFRVSRVHSFNLSFDGSRRVSNRSGIVTRPFINA